MTLKVGAGGMVSYHYDGFTQAGAAAIADMDTKRAAPKKPAALG